MDKFSGSPVTTWVELLVLEAFVGKKLRSLWWGDLLVLESFFGKTLWIPIAAMG